MKRKALTLVAIMTCIWNAYSQAPFQDLDFEAGTVVVSGGGISAADAFPGWQALFNNVPTTTVHYDAGSLGGAVISIVDFNPADGTAPLQGTYSADLFSTTAPSVVATSLSQTGLVPAGTESIQMNAVEEGGTFTVTLNNQTIDMMLWQTVPGYNVYAGDVSQFAGQSADLSITENAAGNPDFLELDNIVFSPTTVTPEPSPFILTAIGGVLFALHRRFLKS